MLLIPDSFKYRLILLFASLSLMVWLPLYLYIDRVYAGQIIEDRHKALQALATAVATVISENLHERQREIALLAKAPLYPDSLNAAELSDLSRVLNQLKASYRYYSWIGFADVQGRVQAATNDWLLGQEVSQRPWFQQGLKHEFVGDLHEAKLLSKILAQPGNAPLRFIDFAAPVYNREHQLLGVVAAHAHWDWADAVMQALAPVRQSQQQVEIQIINAQLDGIYPDQKQQSFSAAQLQRLSQSKAQILQAEGTGAASLIALHPVAEAAADIPLRWQILVHQPLPLILQKVDQLRRFLLAFGVIATLVFLALISWTATRISRPIERIAQTARQIQRGEENLPLLPLEGPQEIRSLQAAIQNMAESLISRRLEVLHINEFLEEKVSQRTQELMQANQALEQLARQDALTGCLNRLAAREQLGAAFSQLHRATALPYSLLVLDIDHFKRINDRFGHAVGDQALQQVSQRIRQNLRHSDRAFRMGGEEFMVLLPATGLEDAQQIAERIRLDIEQHPHPEAGTITLSIGLSQACADDRDEEQAIHRADEALYAAKAAGRNNLQIR